MAQRNVVSYCGSLRSCADSGTLMMLWLFGDVVAHGEVHGGKLVALQTAVAADSGSTLAFLTVKTPKGQAGYTPCVTLSKKLSAVETGSSH